MEENLFLLNSLVLLLVIFYLLDFWNDNPEEHISDSECHVRTRYSIAEKIQKSDNCPSFK